MLKVFMVLNLSIALFIPFSVQADEPNKLVEVTLVSKLDEDRGYCLDIAGGKGRDAPLDKGLQAHTCYNYTGAILEDQGFDAIQIEQGLFRISYFDVCMTVSEIIDGSAISLAKCAGLITQRFQLQPNGQLVIQADQNLCITVNSLEKKEGRGGSPIHVMRPLSLESCDVTKNDYQLWSIQQL